MLCCVVLCCVVLCRVMVCCVVLCWVELCDVVLRCHVVLCCVVLCCVELRVFLPVVLCCDEWCGVVLCHIVLCCVVLCLCCMWLILLSFAAGDMDEGMMRRTCLFSRWTPEVCFRAGLLNPKFRKMQHRSKHRVTKPCFSNQDSFYQGTSQFSK